MKSLSHKAKSEELRRWEDYKAQQEAKKKKEEQCRLELQQRLDAQRKVFLHRKERFFDTGRKCTFDVQGHWLGGGRFQEANLPKRGYLHALVKLEDASFVIICRNCEANELRHWRLTHDELKAAGYGMDFDMPGFSNEIKRGMARQIADLALEGKQADIDLS